MHIQRALMLPPAVVGLLAVALTFTPLLSWVTPAMPEEPAVEDFAWQIRMDVICVASFGLSVLMTLSGGIARPMNFVLSLVPIWTAAVILMLFSTTFIELFDWQMTVKAELLWPGLATWLTLAAGLVLLITSLIVGFFGGDSTATPDSRKPTPQSPLAAEATP